VSQLEKATRSSWKVKSMPLARTALHLERSFSFKEYERISLGCIPRDMDDRWFIYLEGEWLYLHRSWTGFCIYQVRLEAVGNSYRIAESWVNKDREQYVSRSDDYDQAFLSFLMDRTLLGKETPYPADPLKCDD
jgi:hypothetical protein